MLLFKKDTIDPLSELIAVAMWAPAEGQSGVDMYEITKDLKGRFVVCVVSIRQREKDGKRYENYDLKFLINPPLKQSA